MRKAETERLNEWFAARWEEELDFSPIRKTFLGRKDGYDRIDDLSERAEDEQLAWRRRTTAEMKEAFDYDLLTDEAKMSYDVWAYELERAARALPFRRLNYVFTQMQGPQAFLPVEASGVGALPRGLEFYDERLAFATTTGMTADEVHESGHKPENVRRLDRSPGSYRRSALLCSISPPDVLQCTRRRHAVFERVISLPGHPSELSTIAEPRESRGRRFLSGRRIYAASALQVFFVGDIEDGLVRETPMFDVVQTADHMRNRSLSFHIAAYQVTQILAGGRIYSSVTRAGINELAKFVGQRQIEAARHRMVHRYSSTLLNVRVLSNNVNIRQAFVFRGFK